MKLFIIICILFAIQCNSKYDGEIIKLSTGEIFILRYFGTASLYYVEPFDTIKLRGIK